MDVRQQREALWLFRERVYHEGFDQRRDTLFDLLDALVLTGSVPSFVHLSLALLFRRGWGSAYDALAAGVLDEPALREIVASYPLDDGAPLYAVDTSVWARCDAECSPQRAFYHSSSRQSAGQPIVAGWSSSWLAQLSFTHESWTAPLDVRRVPPRADAHAVAAAQIQELCGRAPAGRPRRHGAKFACAAQRTWWPPTDEHQEEHSQYGQVRVRAWGGVHAKTQNHPRRGTRRTKPTVPGTLLLVEVERLPRQTRMPKQLWLWWRGPGQPHRPILWRAYVRRFDLEHTFRFAKQTLNWTTPRVHFPEQADRWTWLVLLAYTERRLARRIAADQRLPWEAAQWPRRAALTPARVRQSFVPLLAWLGTPANAPKPCGRSPGRPKGARSGPAPRYPALKKAA